MKKFGALSPKPYSYLMDDDSKVQKSKWTKKCVIKWELIFENYTDCLLNEKIILKSQQRFKSDHHKVYTEEVKKITLSSNDDKRLQTHDKITTYPYETNAFKVCESEMLNDKRFILWNMYKKWSNLMITLMKIKLYIIKIGHIFEIICTEY